MENLELKVFENPEFGSIRTIEENGKLLFCAKDVAVALGYAKPRNAIMRHCKGALNRGTLTSGGRQTMTFIPEGDVYRLITHSKLDDAQKFERWVYDDVITSVRQHGMYITPQTLERMIADPEWSIQMISALRDLQEAKMAAEAEKNKLLEQAALDAPKVAFADAVALSDKTIKVGDFAKVMMSAGVSDMGRNNFYKWLRAEKILDRDNIPLQRYMKAGYFEVAEFMRGGHPMRVTSITGRGQRFLYGKLLDRQEAMGGETA